ncbi:MAG: polyphosphate kinase, partial [Rhodospirillales bacterium]
MLIVRSFPRRRQRAALTVAEITSEPTIDRTSPDRFINRELSWLAFNQRVLEEAMNPTHPPLERLRFLSISASNLDEFYMVRVAGLKGQVTAGVATRSPENLTAEQQLAAIHQVAGTLMRDQNRVWIDLLRELAEVGVSVVDVDAVAETERDWLEARFLDDIFPILTPIAVDPAHPFPFIPNQGLGIALQLTDPVRGETLEALVLMPSQLERFIRLPGSEARFVLLETLIVRYFDRLFPPFELKGHGVFRVIRDSEMEIDEEAEDLVRTFESALKRRRRGTVIRLSVNGAMPDDLMEFLRVKLAVAPDDVFRFDGLLGLVDTKQLIVGDRPDLVFTPYNARFPERIRDFGGDCFAAIRQKDIVVHHPFESFDVVVQFLRQAARDPQVVAIKQTLYRTSKDSPIVAA